MQRVVYKYHVDPGASAIKAPKMSWQPLSVHVQNGEVFIWALVNPAEKNIVDHRIVVMPTGQSADYEHFEQMRFLGTVLLEGGALVFHIFV